MPDSSNPEGPQQPQGPPPPQSPPPQAPPPPQDPGQSPPAGGSGSENRSIMVVLSYAWILALIPLLVDKDDDVQWHAKHGIVLSLAEIAIYVAVGIVSFLPVVQVLGSCGCALLFPVSLIVRIIAIVKGLGGERFRVPFVSDFADQWK